MPPSKTKNDVQWVKASEIRQIFNNLQLYQKVLSGELVAMVKWQRHRNPPPQGEPVCTRSQILVYYDQYGDEIAMVHQYVRRDGSIGASGKPDPKKLFLPNRVIATRS